MGLCFVFIFLLLIAFIALSLYNTTWVPEVIARERERDRETERNRNTFAALLEPNKIIQGKQTKMKFS